jgi:hypothetical protein
MALAPVKGIRALARELDDQMLLASIAGNTGLAGLFAGELGEAQTAFEKQLRICRQVVIPWAGLRGPRRAGGDHGAQW